MSALYRDRAFGNIRSSTVSTSTVNVNTLSNPDNTKLGVLSSNTLVLVGGTYAVGAHPLKDSNNDEWELPVGCVVERIVTKGKNVGATAFAWSAIPSTSLGYQVNGVPVSNPIALTSNVVTTHDTLSELCLTDTSLLTEISLVRPTTALETIDLCPVGSAATFTGNLVAQVYYRKIV
jgi:hypothetical protein